MKNRKWMPAVLAALCIVLVGCVGYTVYRDRQKEKEAVSESSPTEDTSISWNGKKYKKDPDVYTVLFVGVDKTSQAEIGERSGDAGQSDSLNLFVLNRETKMAQIVQISRDTMVDIDMYNNNNEFIATEEGQIALQYAYGDGGKKSCRLTSERVSELMGGVDVDFYISMSLDGIAAAVDAVGGVPIVIQDDYSEIDPEFTAGKELVLNGEQAERYVRSRNLEELESNNQRMKRQGEFMVALIRKMGDVESESYASLYQSMESYLTTNMTVDQLTALSENTFDEEKIVLPGEVIYRDGHAQFIPDKEEMKKIIIKLFYKEVEK